jgi:protocatechuate 3,4-dioxygenase alpha subunit
VNVRDLSTGTVPATAVPIVVAGRIFDGAGAPVSDAVVEIWQADVDGRYTNGWARAACEDGGAYRFHTIKPGRVRGPDGKLMAPHITLWIVARGINIGLHTRLYFEDEAEANSTDLALCRIHDPRRRETLIAAKSRNEDTTVYTFDIRLQGDGETVFLDV